MNCEIIFYESDTVFDHKAIDFFHIRRSKTLMQIHEKKNC